MTTALDKGVYIQHPIQTSLSPENVSWPYVQMKMSLSNTFICRIINSKA